MRKLLFRYGMYGCILGAMGVNIWNRAREGGRPENSMSPRPVFHPDSSGTRKPRKLFHSTPREGGSAWTENFDSVIDRFNDRWYNDAVERYSTLVKSVKR